MIEPERRDPVACHVRRFVLAAHYAALCSCGWRSYEFERADREAAITRHLRQPEGPSA